MWPTIVVPWVLLVQLWQVLSSPAGKARPSGCVPVSASCLLGVSPRPLTTSPFSVRAVCLVRLLPPCNSSRFLGDHDAFGVLPWPTPDAVARINRGLAVGSLGAEVGMPCMISRARTLREPLTELVRTGQSAEIRTFAGAGAGYEKAHVGLLRPTGAARCRGH